MKINRIAFPQEHGSWGFFLEPLTLALIVAYSYNGLFLAIASFFIFLAHQPIRLIFNKKNNSNDKNYAIAIFLIYSGISLLLLWNVFLNTQFSSNLPFLLAILFMFIFLLIEINTRKENFVARLIPTLSVCLIAVSIVLYAKWDIRSAALFYWVLLSRSVTTSIYIHEKLKKSRKENFSFFSVLFIHALFFVILLPFVLENSAPYFSLLAITVLAFRAFIGLHSKSKTNVKKIGLWEFAHGVIFVIIISIGYVYNI